MTTIDLDALEATARAATPGPWIIYDSSPLGDCHYISGAIGDSRNTVIYAECEQKVAKHIATFDPTTVLALITRLREAEAVIKATAATVNNPRAALNAIEAWEAIYEAREQIARYKPTSPDGDNDA